MPTATETRNKEHEENAVTFDDAKAVQAMIQELFNRKGAEPLHQS
jgi:hypothetical protein